MIPRSSFSILAIALLLGGAYAAVHVHHEDPKFSYSGSSGPTQWGKLNQSFSSCSSGKLQSPVDIIRNQTVLNKKLEPIHLNYSTSANATLLNYGYVIGLNYEADIGGFMIEGKKYKFKQMHWHSPSEHQIDGELFPAVLHLVHEAADGSVAVVSILYKYGKRDPLIKKIEKHLYQLAKEGHDKIHIGKLYTKYIRANTRKYYRYIGSYTTPPCSENVLWSVLAKMRPMSKEQLEALRAPLGHAYKNNSRPVQPLNGRRIEFYDEQHSDEL